MYEYEPLSSKGMKIDFRSEDSIPLIDDVMYALRLTDTWKGFVFAQFKNQVYINNVYLAAAEASPSINRDPDDHRDMDPSEIEEECQLMTALAIIRLLPDEAKDPKFQVYNEILEIAHPEKSIPTEETGSCSNCGSPNIASGLCCV